jgi:hypothetical protein
MTRDEFHERFLEKGRELYEAGDKSELLYCLSHCLGYGRPVPDWLRKAFRDAEHLVRSCQVKSWDDVFGRPFKGGDARLARQRHIYLATQKVFEAICDRHAAGEALDDKLFASVAREYGVGGSTAAKEIYYEIAPHFIATDEETEEALINRTPLKSVSGKIKK